MSATQAGSPLTSTTRKPIKFILEAVDKAGYKAGRDRDIAIVRSTSACSELFEEGDKKGYKFWKSAPDKIFSSASKSIELFSRSWLEKYPMIASIEGTLSTQDDWSRLRRHDPSCSAAR